MWVDRKKDDRGESLSLPVEFKKVRQQRRQNMTPGDLATSTTIQTHVSLFFVLSEDMIGDDVFELYVYG